MHTLHTIWEWACLIFDIGMLLVVLAVIAVGVIHVLIHVLSRVLEWAICRYIWWDNYWDLPRLDNAEEWVDDQLRHKRPLMDGDATVWGNCKPFVNASVRWDDPRTSD